MRQITILSQSQKNMIAAVTEALARANVNIQSISGEDYGVQSVINMTVDDEAAALDILQKYPEWQVMREDAFLIRVEDEIGALAKIARQFDEAHIPLRSIRFIERHNGYALVAISSEKSAEAADLIAEIQKNLI